MRYTATGKRFFVDYNTRTATFQDPRSEEEAKRRAFCKWGGGVLVLIILLAVRLLNKLQ